MNQSSEKPIPLEADAAGILRVAGTRVPVDNVLHEFLAGASAEEIVSSYPTLPLADVYTLIGHYLSHRAELDVYLKKNQDATSAAIAEGRRRQSGLRERLLARLNTSEASSAPVLG